MKLRPTLAHTQEEAYWLEVLCFVVLASRATADKVLHHQAEVRCVEVAMEAVQGALDVLAAVIVDINNEFLE
jgi:hypothetical protein